MEREKRRSELLKILSEAKRPVTGMELGSSLGVSRQIIVQDIAILRASGEQVLATPQGYLNSNLLQVSTRRIIACQHTKEQIEEELGIIIDLGGRILDVIIEHPLYGELRGNLMIASRRDLCLFLQQLKETDAHPLSMLTCGVHLHTLEAADQQNMDEIIGALEKAGFLTK